MVLSTPTFIPKWVAACASPSAARVDVGQGRLAETHEYFHRQLDDTTAFGGLLGTVAALADALSDTQWAQLRFQLQDMSDLVHETFAVGMSLSVPSASSFTSRLSPSWSSAASY